VDVQAPLLLAVPNVSEGRDSETIAALSSAFTVGAGGSMRLLDVHSDADHHRSVFTIAGRAGDLADAVFAGARVAVARIDVMGEAMAGDSGRGQHPHVGALDVAPVVYLEPTAQGAACAEALVLGDRIGAELGVPVFLYGELTADEARPARTRAQLRRGGAAALSARMSTLEPDFGPPRAHPTAGVTLVAARPPLVAFNLQLAAPASLADARAIAAMIREDGTHGLPGVRAIGILLGGAVAQVSINIERPFELSLAEVVQAVGRHAQIATAELVGLAPAAALEDFPADVPMLGFDPDRHVIEKALGS
jgi:glutamate formiminotransferase / 5-formyltetrahydrofolate cyclo-ligase